LAALQAPIQRFLDPVEPHTDIGPRHAHHIGDLSIAHFLQIQRHEGFIQEGKPVYTSIEGANFLIADNGILDAFRPVRNSEIIDMRAHDQVIPSVGFPQPIYACIYCDPENPGADGRLILEGRQAFPNTEQDILMKVLAVFLIGGVGAAEVIDFVAVIGKNPIEQVLSVAGHSVL
jgi:hypothetical protein